MRRRGSMPFVVEIKSSRRRFAPGIPGPVLLEKRSPGFHANGSNALFAMPWNGGESASDPSAEEARLAADKLFGAPVASASSREHGDQQNNGRSSSIDQSRPLGSREETPEERPKPEVQTNAAEGKPRTGRILESLTSKDPLEALFRQKAEEEAPPRRGRPPGSKNIRRDADQATGGSRRKQFTTPPAADLNPPPAVPRHARTTATAESEGGHLQPPVVPESPAGKSRRSPQTPARRRKPAGRVRPVATPRHRNAGEGVKRKAAIGVARKASGRKGDANKRRTVKPIATKGISRKAAQTKKPDRGKERKPLAGVRRKADPRREAARKQAARRKTARSNVARGAAAKKMRSAAAKKSAASKATGKTSVRGTLARNSLESKKPLRTTTSRSKPVRRKASPARPRTRR